jgi:DNA-binding protein HU-beta
MTKSELINNIVAKTNLSKTSCEEVIDVFIDEVKDSLLKGDKVSIKSFANFEVNERPEREGRNPKTGQVVTFPAVKTIKCKFSKAIKDELNGK